jgi:hypothetical protein
MNYYLRELTQQPDTIIVFQMFGGAVLGIIGALMLKSWGRMKKAWYTQRV